MTDLRTAAQAVIDNYELRHKFDMDVLINDLRQALAEPVEPVAWMHPDGRVVSGETMNGARKDGGAILSGLKSHNIPLYTTPPSVDALIAEAIEKHDEKNVLIRTVNMRTQAQPYLDALIGEIEAIPTYTNLYPPFPDNAPPCGKLVQKSLLDEVTDKYRGVK